ncbi:MAG: UPF0158 family protein [Chitinispirillaceae bacterium]
MKKPTEEQIEEIAEWLECGLKSYFNLKTGEIKTLPDFENQIFCDREIWEEEAEDIRENPDDYIEFEELGSREEFRIMADFAKSIPESELKNELIRALNRPKPFRNFKSLIDCSGNYRKKWFDFKKQSYIEAVKEQWKWEMENLEE